MASDNSHNEDNAHKLFSGTFKNLVELALLNLDFFAATFFRRHQNKEDLLKKAEITQNVFEQMENLVKKFDGKNIPQSENDLSYNDVMEINYILKDATKHFITFLQSDNLTEFDGFEGDLKEVFKKIRDIASKNNQD